MLEHYWQNDEIFGENWFSYPNLYKNVVNQIEDGDILVEVGSWKGRSTSFLAVEIVNSNKNVDFYCVDTWEGSVEHQGLNFLPQLYDIFLNNMRPVEGYYIPLKMTSFEASKKFEDGTLKFVFLDASHEYQDIKNDIKFWLPKIKPGGVLAGHDYYVDGYDWFPGVKKAVNEELINFKTQENCWIYEVPIPENPTIEKLKNFPSVNFISIEESQDRRDLLYKNFKKFGITNITPHIYKKYNDNDHSIIEGSLQLHSSGRGPVTSHLKAIKEWYENTDEEYTFFCEDDLSFDSLECWNFTWEEFFNKLPDDWDCVQLCLVRESMFEFSFPDTEFKFRHRCFDDWSGCAYLIHRRHAKNLIDNYHPNESIHLEYKGIDREYRVGLIDAYWFLLPQIENLIYSCFGYSCFDNGRVYSFPLFLENVIDFQSTWQDFDTNLVNKNSYHQVLDWWKTRGKNFTLQQLF